MEGSGQFTDYIISLGTGGIFCILILQQVLNFLAKKKEREKPAISSSDVQALKGAIDLLNANLVRQSELHKEIKNKIDKVLSLIYDLHRWHDVDDPNHPGAKIWWATSLKESRDEIAKLQHDISELLDRLRRSDTHGDNQ